MPHTFSTFYISHYNILQILSEDENYLKIIDVLIKIENRTYPKPVTAILQVMNRILTYMACTNFKSKNDLLIKSRKQFHIQDTCRN